MTASPSSPSRAYDRAVVESVLEVARRSPSIHNTQPWLWELRPDRLDLRADRSRQLAVADPDGHSFRVSCGAALHLAVTAFRATGYAVDVTRFPDAGDADLLARLTLSGSTEPDAEAQADVEAALVRRTDRRPFRFDDVSDQLLDELRAASAVEGVHVDFPMQEDQRIALASAVSWADRAERHDPAYLEEMARWVSDRDVHNPRPDGIPTDVVPHVTVAHPRHTDVPLRDFEVGAAGRQLIEQDVDERPVMAVVLTDSDAPDDQFRAGEAMMRLWLAGDRAGLRSCPVSQAVDIGAFRYRLQGLMGWVGLPQVVLRIGRPIGGDVEPPLTPRRPVQDFLRVID